MYDDKQTLVCYLHLFVKIVQKTLDKTYIVIYNRYIYKQNKQGRNIFVTARLSYIYWSYEPYGMCYIGVRQCYKKYSTPELDINYFGTYKDKTFKPTHKIILNVFDNHEDAKDEEV